LPPGDTGCPGPPLGGVVGGVPEVPEVGGNNTPPDVGSGGWTGWTGVGGVVGGCGVGGGGGWWPSPRPPPTITIVPGAAPGGDTTSVGPAPLSAGSAELAGGEKASVGEVTPETPGALAGGETTSFGVTAPEPFGAAGAALPGMAAGGRMVVSTAAGRAGGAESA
jgi:hypothetical protein